MSSQQARFGSWRFCHGIYERIREEVEPVDRIPDLIFTETAKVLDLRDAQVQFAFHDKSKDEVSFPLAVELDRETGRQFLFSAELAFQSDLEQPTPILSTGFRQIFESHKVLLSDDASKVTITTDVVGGQWRIDDTDQRKTYTVIRKDGTLNIYGGEIDRVRLGRRESSYMKSDEDVLVGQFQPRSSKVRFGLTEYVIHTGQPLWIPSDFQRRAEELIIEDNPLFTIGLGFVSQLDAKQISEELRKHFSQNGFALDEEAQRKGQTQEQQMGDRR